MNTTDTQQQSFTFDSTLDDDEIVTRALQVLERKLGYHTNKSAMRDPEDAKTYLRLRLSGLEHEVFLAMFLDNRHRLIECREMFRGTINGCSVHPREIVKAALHSNAATVIFAHNHPSGDAEPSAADKKVTDRLKEALDLIDVRVLDHIVVGDSTVSFAERGLL